MELVGGITALQPRAGTFSIYTAEGIGGNVRRRGKIFVFVGPRFWNNEAPLFLGARMTNGVTVLTPQIEVYLGAGRPAGPARKAAFPTKYTRSAS